MLHLNRPWWQLLEMYADSTPRHVMPASPVLLPANEQHLGSGHLLVSITKRSTLPVFLVIRKCGTGYPSRSMEPTMQITSAKSTYPVVSVGSTETSREKPLGRQVS